MYEWCKTKIHVASCECVEDTFGMCRYSCPDEGELGDCSFGGKGFSCILVRGRAGTFTINLCFDHLTPSDDMESVGEEEKKRLLVWLGYIIAGR